MKIVISIAFVGHCLNAANTSSRINTVDNVRPDSIYLNVFPKHSWLQSNQYFGTLATIATGQSVWRLGCQDKVKYTSMGRLTFMETSGVTALPRTPCLWAPRFDLENVTSSHYFSPKLVRRTNQGYLRSILEKWGLGRKLIITLDLALVLSVFRLAGRPAAVIFILAGPGVVIC